MSIVAQTPQTIYFNTKGKGDQPVVFLHGLWGGGNYFPYLDIKLPANVIAYYPDELGFGKSPKPDIAYTPDAHCKALAKILGDASEITLVGHSFGTVLAAHFASLYPERVKKLILISPLIYQTSEEARKYLATRFITRLTLKQPLIAKGICLSLCSTGMLGRVSPFFVRGIKRQYITGCTQHTWHSYESSLRECVVHAPIFQTLTMVAKRIPIALLYGDRDNYANAKTMQRLPGRNITQTIVKNGTHNLLLSHSELCNGYIEKKLGHGPSHVANP